MEIAVVDDLEEEIRGIRADREIADLVDQKDVGVGVGGECFGESPPDPGSVGGRAFRPAPGPVPYQPRAGLLL